MQLPYDSTNLILAVRLATDGETPITGIAYDSGSLAVSYRKSTASGGFTNATLVDGTLGTYVSNSWKEIGSGLYQYCPPNAIIEAGKMAVLKVVYGSNQPRLDQLEFTGPSLSTPVATVSDETISSIVSRILASGTGLYNIVRGDTLTIRIADEFEQQITGLGDLTGNDDIVFALQERAGVANDNSARLSVSRVSGLTRLNGSSVADSSLASITVDDAAEGIITVRVSSAVTASLVAAERVDCVKVIKASGNDRTPRAGKTIVTASVIDRRG